MRWTSKFISFFVCLYNICNSNPGESLCSNPAHYLSFFATPHRINPKSVNYTNDLNPKAGLILGWMRKNLLGRSFNESTFTYKYGAIEVFVLNGGFTTVNTTLPTHILYDGRVDRTISQSPDGSWIVTTHGYGNNETRYAVFDPQRPDLNPIIIPVNLSSLNGWGGPILPGGVDIFNTVDEQMLNYIQANH